MKKISLLFFLVGLLALTPLGYYVYIHTGQKQEGQQYATFQFATPQAKEMVPGTEFIVLNSKVVDGYIFKILLENGVWIEGHLKNATKDEATDRIIELFGSTNSANVYLIRKVKNYWIVDFRFGSEKRSLAKWLTENNLTL